MTVVEAAGLQRHMQSSSHQHHTGAVLDLSVVRENSYCSYTMQ